MANKWISHVKDFASKNGMDYRNALKDPKCRASYKKGSNKTKRGGGPCDGIKVDSKEYENCMNHHYYSGGGKSKRRRGGKKRKGTRKR
jgi:hypothetical protein